MEAFNWEDTQAILLELKSVYESKEDSDAVNRLRESYSEAKSLFDQRRQDMRAVIQGLSSRIAAAKAKAERPEPSDAFLARMASLEREKAAMVARIDALLADKSATESSLIEIRKKALEVEEAMREVEGAASEDISRIKHAMLLYANITNIKWDFSDERRVAGIIAPPEGKSKVFDIDPATSSEFDTCQQLWKLMG